MPELFTVPYLGTAEKDVLVVDWLVDEGDAFRRGQPLVTLETLKASFEVEAEGDGVLLRQLEAVGDRVGLQAPLGVWGQAGETLVEAEVEELLAAQAVPDVEVADPTPKAAPVSGAANAAPASPAARRRATDLGIDLASIQGTGPNGMVRVEDVERSCVGDSSTAEVATGAVDAAFLAHVRANLDEFGVLESSFKVDLYRRHGARIGADVEFGKGVAPLAERLVLGRGVRFADGCRVEAVDLVAGALTAFGPRCAVRCRSISLGENAFLAADVDIGGGGAMDPEAELVMGGHGFVGEHAHLNPCRRLVVGDEVVISRSAVIMTHSFGSSALAGYAARFAGVTIGDGCQVGIGATLFPGVEMGRGSILLSGSSLVTAMPEYRLWGGVPAKDLKAAAHELDAAALLGVAQDLAGEFARQLQLRGFAVSLQVEADERELVVDHEGRRHRLHLAPLLDTEEAAPCAEDVRVGLAADDDAWASLLPELVGIDLSVPRVRGALGPMANAFREFLRKRGVRLHPRTWAYRGGWL
ncbi:MAG: hypothetical protein CMJ85_02030 [Planctomycetes bacterium]|nr:hypothetical protein [Planctomycetota bacterium]